MRIDQLNVVLRSRSSWEAMELGTALARHQARAAWGAWLLASAPLFLLANALAWWHGDAFGWAWLLLWWCKPLFERVVLYVLSRDVFGEPVGAWQALRAQRHWGVAGFWGYLGWRRFSLLRNVCLPVNLLEGADAAQRAQRRRAVLAATAGPSMLLTLVCLGFEIVLVAGSVAAVFLFVPVELMSDSWRAAWELIDQDTPAWAKLGWNLLWWLAACVIGPFHIGAGFGLYVNRRTQMEAWDVEISFRRLRERLQRAAPMVVLLLAVALPAWPPTAHAQEAAQDAVEAAAQDDVPAAGDTADGDAGEDEDDRIDPDDTPAGIFGDEEVDTAGFRQAVQRAYEDPLQRPTREVTTWQPRDAEEARRKERERLQREREKQPPTELAKRVASLLALVAEWGLWLLLGGLLLVLLVTARRWLPWLRGSGRRAAATQREASEDAIVLPEVVPPDVATRARDLWARGMPRQALALLYRASVQTVVERSGVVLPPGATEAQVLRVSRRMPDARDRSLFADVVRMWQYAAYANRLPHREAFEQLADALQAQYRWPA
ncbi:DUF4129 domain-containing protein [Stenotrophomonas tumulicola]|uniref:DUF4129 domain-containing protein n=1 Tax=Stenotrophomonas tumulicola TaxID=1685415 RepID=A0A7W3FMD7_9GAMM|nr:DUF4129 domain-containing protein [Stenotrophomonas tumulicola]